ncbi:E3 ubiquitin-protein ligase SIN-like [Parasponia andersonii]|uniref:E3 ubiquitin-protein ligase SIN-like n=1 Tax=Parasponia andersonii TaxID=3476 RepID=A0A2P5C116_PARAD|nr:E3 ubiquitin-protein ligase SIN-like [Parasponia andersonii]
MRFTWAICNFSRLSVKKIYSDIFFVGGYKWRILVFPKGNKVDDLSVYLVFADSVTLPHGWSRYAPFSLSVINHFDSNATIIKELEHEFTARERGWGLASLIPLRELNDPARGFIVKDTCTLEAEVRLKKEQDEDELTRKEERDSVESQQEPRSVDLQPVEAQIEPKPVDSRTVILEDHVIGVPRAPGNLAQEQTAQVAVPSIDLGEQTEQENLVAKTINCPQAITPVTFSTESSQNNELVTLMADNVQEAKTATTPCALIVDPPSFQSPQEPTFVEAEISSSDLSEFDALFTEIQNLLGGESSKQKSTSSFCCPIACSDDEISQAKEVFKACLNLKLATVIQSGRHLELKKSLSIMLTGKACPDNMVNFTTKFLGNFEQYTSAQQDLREVQEKEKSIRELETTMKQLVSDFVLLRNQAEAVDQEVAELERRLTEKKAKKAWLRKSLADLAGRAITSKQAFIDAREVMLLLRIKKEQAEKTAGEMESSWEHLKSGIP